jgi:hypothetical protein
LNFDKYQSMLEQAGVNFESGLTAGEVQQIESRFSFAFPPDYRAFLMHSLPVSDQFVNWRNTEEKWRNTEETKIHHRLAWPLEGICFDIEYNAFWLPEWGQRPKELQDAFAIAREAVAQAPVLIPIYSHRYIPALPAEAGNPIFSVYQTDIIYYGRDLSEYIENEFAQAFGKDYARLSEPIRPITFWSHLVELNG